MQKPQLTIPLLINAARDFSELMTNQDHPDLLGVTDGKAVGTYVEHFLFRDLFHSPNDA